MNAMHTYFLMFLVLVSTVIPSRAGDLVVAVDSTLKFAFFEVKDAFDRKEPLVKLHLHFDEPNQLKTQLEKNFLADIFITHSDTLLRELNDLGLIESGTLEVFAANYIVLAHPGRRGSPVKSLKDLTSEDIKSIGIVEGTNSAIAAITTSILTTSGLDLQLKPKYKVFATTEEIANAVEDRKIDAGFIATCDASRRVLSVSLKQDALTQEPMKFKSVIMKRGKDMTIPETVSSPTQVAPTTSPNIEQAKNALKVNKEDAAKFIAFLRSEDARKILQKYGFVTVL